MIDETYDGAYEHEYWLGRTEGYCVYAGVEWEAASPRRPYTSAVAATFAGRVAGVRERRADEKLRRDFERFGPERKAKMQPRYLEAFERLSGSGALNKVPGLRVARAPDLTPSDAKAAQIAEAMREAGIAIRGEET